MPPRADIPPPERDNELPRRRCRPIHYVVEIKSVSELLKLPKYKFGVFQAGGHKWSLRLYPKGYEDREGKKHMSMYLSIEEPKSLGDRRVVVDYKFFVFDYNRGEYVTFKEQGKELRAFTRKKVRWGFSKFLSLATFEDPKNGYCSKNNCCKFGAEVLVSEPQRMEETLTIIRDPRPNKITVKIQQFSASNSNNQYSADFPLAGRKWKLKAYPKRVSGVKWLSVYLEARDISPGKKIYVEANLRLLNKKDTGNKKDKMVKGWLSDKERNCGCKDFMPWEHLEQWNELVFDVGILIISYVERRDERV